MPKTKTIAIIEKNGVKVLGGKVTTVSENEYKQIVNNTLVMEQKEDNEKVIINNKIDALFNKCKELELEIKILKGEE